MTRGQYHAAKEDYRIGSDIEAHGAILFVIALLEAEQVELEGPGGLLPEESNRIAAVEVAIDIAEALLHTAEAFAAGEV